ncbi:MAG: protein kinase, partial [Burkholderiales bacterium]
EQARGNAVDKRADVWAFGCVLYEMLTGQRAFPGNDLSDTLAAVIKSEPDWTRLPPDTPPSIRRALRRCLQKSPADRLPDIGSARLEIRDAETAPSSELPPAVAVGQRRERMAWTSAAMLAVTATIAIVVAATRSPAPAAPEMRVEIVTPPTPYPLDFALSPDGRWLAFVARADGEPHLWLRSLGDGSMRAVKGTAEARSPFWSPDSRSVGLKVANKLKRLDLADGSLRDLVVSLVGPNITASWNRDDVILYSNTPGPVRRVSATTRSEPIAATRLAPQQSGHILPWFLPDGRHFLYQALGLPEARGVFVGALDGGEPTRLVDADDGAVVTSGHVLFVRQGALLAQALDRSGLGVSGEPFRVADGIAARRRANRGVVSVSTTGTIAFRPGGTSGDPALVWFDRAGREIGPVIDGADYLNPELSADGRWLVAQRDIDGNVDVWTHDTVRGGWTRATTDETTENHAVLSPDGQRVAFFSLRDGARRVYVKRADGSGAEEEVITTSGL